MEHVSFNFQIVPILIGLLGFIILLLLRVRIPRGSFLRSLWLSGLVLFGLYFLMMTTVVLFRVYDLNYYEAGVFESIEEKERVTKRIVNDTGVQLAFITIAIFSLFISFFVLAVSLISNYIKRSKSRRLKENLT